MLLNQAHFEKLKNAAWVVVQPTDKEYYIKYVFLTNDEYLFLVTDLRLVWFEHGHHEQIQLTVKEQLGMECKDRAASMLMYKKIKAFLPEGIYTCSVHEEQSQVKFFLPLEKQVGDIAALTWVFDCRLLEQHGGDGLSGPQVIFEYFLVPSQNVVNYFTEKVLDDLPEKSSVPKGKSSFSRRSLDYFRSLQQIKEMNGVIVTQGPIEPTLTEENPASSSQRQEELEQEKEIKRKRDLAAYYAKRPTTQKKKRF